MCAGVAQRDDSSQIHRFFIGLQKRCGCLAIGCDGPGGQPFIRVEGQRAVFLLMDGSNIDEPPLLFVRPSLWKCCTSDERITTSWLKMESSTYKLQNA